MEPVNGKDMRKVKRCARSKVAWLSTFTCVLLTTAIGGLSCAQTVVSSDVPEQPASQGTGASFSPEPNSPPDILSMTAATDRIGPSTLSEVVCEAVDSDGDELTYVWESPVGQIRGTGPNVQWNAPEDEGLFRVTVTVDDGRGGVVEQSISVRVRTNQAPQIQTLSSGADWVPTGKSVYLSCSADDADGDEVSYEWEAEGGEFFGTGRGVVWLAPEEEGSYWLTVWARDTYGGETKRAMPMTVTYHEPPTLGRFRVKSPNPDLLRPAGDAWKILKGNTATIQCVVAEGVGPFTYEWRASQGTLESEGAEATWHAPLERVSADIIVEVTDVHGATATGSILIYVETCGCAF